MHFDLRWIKTLASHCILNDVLHLNESFICHCIFDEVMSESYLACSLPRMHASCLPIFHFCYFKILNSKLRAKLKIEKSFQIHMSGALPSWLKSTLSLPGKLELLFSSLVRSWTELKIFHQIAKYLSPSWLVGNTCLVWLVFLLVETATSLECSFFFFW